MGSSVRVCKDSASAGSDGQMSKSISGPAVPLVLIPRQSLKCIWLIRNAIQPGTDIALSPILLQLQISGSAFGYQLRGPGSLRHAHGW